MSVCVHVRENVRIPIESKCSTKIKWIKTYDEIIARWKRTNRGKSSSASCKLTGAIKFLKPELCGAREAFCFVCVIIVLELLLNFLRRKNNTTDNCNNYRASHAVWRWLNCTSGFIDARCRVVSYLYFENFLPARGPLVFIPQTEWLISVTESVCCGRYVTGISVTWDAHLMLRNGKRGWPHAVNWVTIHTIQMHSLQFTYYSLLMLLIQLYLPALSRLGSLSVSVKVSSSAAAAAG